MEVTSKAGYEQPKVGLIKAVCLSVVDGRYDCSDYKGIKYWSRRVFLVFEINQKITRGEVQFIGKNMVISKEYTLSSSPDSRFRKDLEHWRGVRFGERVNNDGTVTLMTKKINNETGQVEETEFKTESLEGIHCMLKLEDIGKEKSYVAITEIYKLPKGKSGMIRENNIGYLPDGLARKIALRPEVNPDELSEIRGYSDGYLGEEDDEEVPF